MSSWLPALLVVAVAFASTSNAIAQYEETIGVSFSAPDDCATVGQWKNGVTSRLPAVKLDERSGADVEIVIRRDEPGVHAELNIHLKGGEQLTRSITAEDCASAVEAIAFVTAVALDPGAPEPIVLRNAKEEPASVAPSESGEPPPPDRSTPKKPKRSTSTKSSSGERKGNQAYGDVLLGARLQTGAAPGPLYGVDLGFSWGASRPGLWSPSSTLSFGFGVAGGFEEEGGTAVFTLAEADLLLCPSRVRWGPLDLRPCGQLQVGPLWSQGKDTLSADSALKLWSTAGVAADLALRFAKRWRFYARAGAVFPFVRDEYQFEPQVFHRVPVVSLAAASGFSLRFD